MAEEEYESKFYWVKLKPYTSDVFPNEGVKTPDFEPMMRFMGGWCRAGVIRRFEDDEVEELGPPCQMEDAGAAKQLKSVMVDINEMRDLKAEAEHSFGPFHEWNFDPDGNAVIRWINLGELEGQYRNG